MLHTQSSLSLSCSFIYPYWSIVLFAIMLGSKKTQFILQNLFYYYTKSNSRQKFITQNCSATDEGIKRILFDNYCIAPNKLTIITTINITERTWINWPMYNIPKNHVQSIQNKYWSNKLFNYQLYLIIRQTECK